VCSCSAVQQGSNSHGQRNILSGLAGGCAPTAQVTCSIRFDDGRCQHHDKAGVTEPCTKVRRLSWTQFKCNVPLDSTVATAPSPLEELLSKTPTSFLQPYCFFVSWQGVLTLAFRSPILLHIPAMPTCA
jgi:hypothetical protein